MVVDPPSRTVRPSATLTAFGDVSVTIKVFERTITYSRNVGELRVVDNDRAGQRSGAIAGGLDEDRCIGDSSVDDVYTS